MGNGWKSFKRSVQVGWFSSLSQFDDGLTNNRYAGDNYTGNNVSAYAVGVDCSGFVSRCWGTSSKYGTSTIPNISTALSSLNDLRRGDCLNYAGHHVRLAAEDNPTVPFTFAKQAVSIGKYRIEHTILPILQTMNLEDTTI